MLKPGDRFPDVTVQTVDGPTLTIPGDVEGANKVVFYYRGGW